MFVLSWPVELVIMVEYPLLHFKAIRISPEGLVGIEVVKHPEVHSHVLALVVFDWYLTQLYIKLDEVIELVREPDMNNSSFIS